MHRVLLLVAVAAMLLLVAAPPALAAPSPGGRYDGRSATGQRITLRVSDDGSRVSGYLLEAFSRCSDDRTRRQGLIEEGERPTAIDANGAFATTAKPQRFTYVVKGKRVRGRYRFRFSGAFSPAGDVVTGTISASFDSKRLDCSTNGPIPFTAYLDGTPGAPWRDAQMATGTYEARARDLVATVRVLAPGRELRRAVVSWQARCGSKELLRSSVTFRNYRLRGARLSTGGRDTDRIGPGGRYSATQRWRLELRFSNATEVTGRWRVKAVVRRRSDGAVIDTCRLRRTFAGAWVSGPQ